MPVDEELLDRFRQVKLMAMDVDGVLTDGGVYVLEDGTEMRRFDIKDGLGMKRVMAAGVPVVWISAGKCEAVRHRARRLGIEEVYLGAEDKFELLASICLNKGISLEDTLYIGDDLTDLEVLERVGLPCAPADAVEEISVKVRYVTRARGGRGAIREICDLLLSRSLLGTS